MKKLLAIVLAALMLLSLVACAAKKTEEVKEEVKEEIKDEANEVVDNAEEELADIEIISGVPNPNTYYDTLEEINDLTGAKLARPGVMGISDEKFCVIDGDPKTAQYTFSVNGVEYVYRFSSAYDKDITGIYVDGKTVFEDTAENYVEFAEGKAARRLTVDGQYTLVAKDNGTMDFEQFKSIADEIFTGVVESDTCGEYAGNWHEVTAGRASLEATADGSNLAVKITWSNSAAEVYIWELEGKKADDGMVYYNNGVKKDVVFNEEGVDEETILSEAECGYFTLTENGHLIWMDEALEGAEPVEFELD